MDKTKWEWRRIEEVCDKASSNIVLNKIEDNVGDYPLYGASGYVKSVDFFHMEQPYVGIVKDGAGVGRVGVYPAKSSLVGTMQYIIPKKGCMLQYLSYGLQSLHLDKHVSGATIPHIYFKNYGKDTIPFPPLSDQQAIVAELDKLNEVIALKRKQLVDLDSLAQSLFYEMFGDPVVNERGWKTYELKTLFKVTSSKRILQSEWQKEGIPFYKVADIVSIINEENVLPATFIRETDYNTLKDQGYVPICGDLLITTRGTLGQCYIINENDKFYFQDGMITWLSQKCKDLILPIYLKSLFGTRIFLDSLLHTANMSTVAYLSISQLANKTIPLPPLPLQQSFAAKIAKIEAEKQRVKASLKDLETLLASRMQYWFDN